jgi:hypothetical protein
LVVLLLLINNTEYPQQGDNHNKEMSMSFTAQERTALLACKGVGPKVIERLEQMGFSALLNSVAQSLTISSPRGGARRINVLEKQSAGKSCY